MRSGKTAIHVLGLMRKGLAVKMQGSCKFGRILGISVSSAWLEELSGVSTYHIILGMLIEEGVIWVDRGTEGLVDTNPLLAISTRDAVRQHSQPRARFDTTIARLLM